MAFIETQFPVDISYGAEGGPGFITDVAVVDSGFEQRNSAWVDERCEYDVSYGVKTRAQMESLLAFFRVVKGRLHAFRFKDWLDYQATATNGIFTAIDATHFQMCKIYTSAGLNYIRTITKPVNGTVTVTGGSVESINYTTGVVTMTSGTPTAWEGDFDVPCRFDVDKMKPRIIDHEIFSWESIPIVEVRI